MNRLKELFDEVIRCSIEFDRHAESLNDVVFDLITAKSGVIGIADQLLSNMIPSPDQLVVLDKRFMQGNVWLLIDGSKCDLTIDDVLLRNAQLIVSLQQECRAYLKSRYGRWN